MQIIIFGFDIIFVKQQNEQSYASFLYMWLFHGSFLLQFQSTTAYLVDIGEKKYNPKENY